MAGAGVDVVVVHVATLPRCTQDAIFNLLVILFYIPQSKSSQVYRKTFYRANDFHFGLAKKLLPTVRTQQVVTAVGEGVGGKGGTNDRVSDRQHLRQRTKFSSCLAHCHLPRQLKLRVANANSFIKHSQLAHTHLHTRRGQQGEGGGGK